MPSFAAIEREHLVRALKDAGPAAPTLCAGWTAHDLAAHLVARERRPDSGPGLLIGALAGWTERVRRGYTRRPFEELLRLIASGPPLTSPFALPGVDAAVNLSEHFVHTEDVRRAADAWQPRGLDPGLEKALWRMLTARGRLLLRRVPAAVVLATPDGQRDRVKDGDGEVVLTGTPGELVLYAFGRRDHARVNLSGDDAALARLHQADLGV